MAFNEHFSFATDSLLWPIYYEDDFSYPGEIDLFPDLQLDPTNPATHSVEEQPNVLEHSNPPPQISSCDLLTDFTNPQYVPYLENQWDEPLPFVAPPHTMVQHHQPQFQPQSVVPQQQTLAHANSDYSLDDDDALDSALNPEPEMLPQYHQQMPQQPVHYHHHYVVPNPMYANQSMFYGSLPPVPVKSSKRRVVDDDDDDDILGFETESMDFGEDEDPTGGFKLPASKSPIMEAMVVCALNSWGIEIITNNRPTSTTPAEVVFRVTDFNRYYKISRAICSKQRPTDDLGSRIKSLRRWFVNFPKKKDRCENAFSLIVKPSIAKKVNEIIDRNSKTLGLTKRRRRQ